MSIKTKAQKQKQKRINDIFMLSSVLIGAALLIAASLRPSLPVYIQGIAVALLALSLGYTWFRVMFWYTRVYPRLQKLKEKPGVKGDIARYYIAMFGMMLLFVYPIFIYIFITAFATTALNISINTINNVIIIMTVLSFLLVNK